MRKTKITRSFRIEMRFKFWLQPGIEECYHELLDNGTSIYFMYEILNAHSHDSSIVAYFRNGYNGTIVALSTTPQRGHLEIIVNETSSIDFFFPPREINQIYFFRFN